MCKKSNFNSHNNRVILSMVVKICTGKYSKFKSRDQINVHEKFKKIQEITNLITNYSYIMLYEIIPCAQKYVIR
ncbi:hypothetical protein RCL_jg29567.t1 [Rhizophagus clarus]|uniref:Uncharacterized protein n=1 Tax=Rhizophagus clarus TaxID=94130 RepID=A0A8H3L0W9_9GLOM|nr:hypothetical protein RCL_jg29567.t1 [Rhizophagus clarus]